MAERTIYVGKGEQPSRVVVDPAAIDHPILADFLDYWRAKRRSRPVPKYADFVPREMAKYLGSVIVADALAGYEDFRYRLIGSRVARYFLSDGTGRTIREEFGGELAEFLIALNRQACLENIPIRLTGPAAIVDDVLFPSYDTVYLPYATDERADKIVSVFAFEVDSLAARNVALPPSPDLLKVISADELVRPNRNSNS